MRAIFTGFRVRLLFVLAAPALALAACAPPGAPAGPRGGVAGTTASCADIFASAMASRNAVRGSWDCLNPTIQDQFRTAGMAGDDGVAKLASKAPVYTRLHYLGRLEDGAYVYSLAGDAGSTVLLVWLDHAGKVADVRTGGRSAA